MKPTGTIEEYLKLLDMDYHDAIIYLKDKYGKVKDNYYTKKSYQKFLNGINKSPTRGKYSRSNDGLECHHILENKYHNISNKNDIKSYNYPFEFQKSDQLVYCNLIEHLILHTLITKETFSKYGSDGYTIYLAPNVFDWYISQKKSPCKDYHAFIYKAAYLNLDDAKQILSLTNQIVLGDISLKYVNPLDIFKLSSGHEINYNYYDEKLKKYIKKNYKRKRI